MKKLIKIKNNAGMSYIELIVVLSIFAVISSVVIFNYGDFQAKVDIKNLASDIALQVVQAQKSSISGLLPTLIPTVSPWKPSYGVYFNMAMPKQFIYFVDLNNNKIYDETPLDTILITKNNFISRIDKCSDVNCGSPAQIAIPLSITFKRPDSKANFTDSSGNDLVPNGSDYIRITIASPRGATALIKLYPSGRVQVN